MNLGLIIENLPKEILLQILSYLDETSVGRMSATSKMFKELCYCNDVWKKFHLNKDDIKNIKNKRYYHLKIPKYISKSKKLSYRTSRIRRLYWFYKRGIHTIPQLNSAKMYASLTKKYLEDCEVKKKQLENTGCIPKSWLR